MISRDVCDIKFNFFFYYFKLYYDCVLIFHNTYVLKVIGMSLTLVMLHVTFLPQFISTLPQLINSSATTIIIMLVVIEIVLSSSHHFFLFLSRITSHCLSYSILSNLFLYCSSNKGIRENEWKEMEGKETCCKHIYYT